VSRFHKALLGALALHGLLFLVRARQAPHLTPERSSSDEQVVELEDAPVVEAAPETPPTSGESESAPAPNAPGAVALHASSRVPQASLSNAEAGTDAPASADGAADAASAPSAVASADTPARKIDLGLDGHFFMRPPSEEFPRVRKSTIQRELEASIAASDVQHGLARGNALLGSLNAAVRDSGPTRGEALVRVTVNADGSMTDLEFLQGSASEWASALLSFRQLAAHKHVRVPPGARGLRVTFSVKAKVQMPSGKEIPGVDVAGPSLAPNGMTLHGTFDVADLGAGPQRLVYAHVVSEEIL
jgi:hypothetical protein